MEAGKVYLWQLTASVRGTRITAPRPPAPEARFLVAPVSERSRLADLAARFPEEHVLLGVLYAQAGALADARREWRVVTEEGHAEAARLAEQLEVRRQK